MEIRFSHQPNPPARRFTGLERAFTLTELLVVLGMIALLAGVMLSAAFTTQERVLRAECADNLRQIGVGLNLYANEANDYFPICGWPSSQNPWQTYQAARVLAGTNLVIVGYENLGLLVRTKIIPDPKSLYCPSTSQINTYFSYESYSATPYGWPFIPADFSGNPYIRTGYNYYPQLRVTELVPTPYGVFTLPKLTFSPVKLEFGGTGNLVTPAKWSDLNPRKSVVTDLVNSTSQLSHRASGSVAGLNALFPDGTVSFQPARNHNQKGSNQPFDPKLWDPLDAGGPGNDPAGFRIIMNGWTP